ncbi:hypothetical protein GGR56DRAFT_358521 [Xylariaceae sp. FL0804]|nr:hypothetical protein GGR56DRAFT_358521 [Xylariaceae sp. FL0804]
MKPTAILSGLAALALAGLAAGGAAEQGPRRHTAAVYIQPIVPSSSSSFSSSKDAVATGPGPAPVFLAEIRYGSSGGGGSGAAAEITAYEAPSLPDEARLVRVGVYDAAAGRWASGTTVAAASNFARGYAPTIMLSVDDEYDDDVADAGPGGGVVLSAALRGVAVDAGQTRDFGPRAVVLRAQPGKQPELNRPVVLSPEGRKVVVEEKSFLQKYVLYPSHIHGPPQFLLPLLSLPPLSLRASLLQGLSIRKGSRRYDLQSLVLMLMCCV